MENCMSNVSCLYSMGVSVLEKKPLFYLFVRACSARVDLLHCTSRFNVLFFAHELLVSSIPRKLVASYHASSASAKEISHWSENVWVHAI